MSEIPNWPTESPVWEDKFLDLLRESSTGPVPDTDLNNIINLSNEFPIKFPIDTARCKTLLSSVKKEILERNIKSAYPLIHESALYLYAQFILHKRNYGTTIEKNLYKNLSITDLVQRLLTKRAVMFMGKYDQYILMNNRKGSGKWNTIGKDNEKEPLVLKNCISYDEIKLSVFLSVSSYSYFINDGTRKNNGIVAKSRINLEPEGIIIGLIGVRLKRINAMEFQETVITATQNISENGYGTKDEKYLPNVFLNFYDEASSTYEHVQSIIETENNERFIQLQNDQFFDNVVYAKRLTLSFDTLLLEANQRAKEDKKSAYVHLVGIGLGVWKISDHQKNIFVATFLQRIRYLGSILRNVSDVDFAYFGTGIDCDDYKEGYVIKIDGHPNTGVKIHVSKREPYTKVDTGKLLVVSYAWDGNAQPGNEFWKGLLGSTGDSSTASSSQVSELHNPHINKMVSADNLMVVTNKGHVPINKYIDSFKKYD